MAGKYDDMMELPHPVSPKRARMTRLDRAAQFAPFAALTGFDAVITETGRLTEAEIQLDESRKEVLNRRLQYILRELARQPEVRVIYFRADERKAGGAYVEVSGRVKKVDAYAHTLVLADGTVIPVDAVRELNLEE